MLMKHPEIGVMILSMACVCGVLLHNFGFHLFVPSCYFCMANFKVTINWKWCSISKAKLLVYVQDTSPQDKSIYHTLVEICKYD